MSKANERAFERCPKSEDVIEEMRNEIKRAQFIEGYHQAEKDLLENKHETSWRLDEKLWEGIKDIEEASYQYMYDASNDWAYDIPTWKDVQDAFKAGSEWKKDLALTVEDIIAIDDLFTEVFKVVDVKTNEYYQEVLKRFNEIKLNNK